MFHGRKVRSKHFSILALCNLQKKGYSLRLQYISYLCPRRVKNRDQSFTLSSLIHNVSKLFTRQWLYTTAILFNFVQHES